MKRFLTTLLLSWLVLLAACQDTDSLQGEVMLWHSWPEADTAVLEQILTSYEEINPGVTVLEQRLEPDQLAQRYTTAVSNGLGPDLVILPSTAIVPLAEANVITPLNSNSAQLDTNPYFTAALGSMTYNDQLYGLPLTLEPWVMFYNPQQVETPATTLDELLTAATSGQQVALNTSFEGAFWGFQAFGGQILTEEGEVTLGTGGVANWLRWLQQAQSTPGVILSRDSAALTDVFTQGTAAYLVAPISQYPALVEQMGAEQVAVTQLPSGPGGAAGPLLPVEGVLFNPYSSDNQKALALNLAQFVTNTEQSRLLMRATGRAPANRDVRVLASAYPVVAAVTGQARTAVSTRYKEILATLTPIGDRVLAETLEGRLEINDGLALLTDSVTDTGLTAITPTPTSCTLSGELMLSHSWHGPAEAWLEAEARNYMATCPGTLITLNRINNNALLGLYQAQFVAQTAPALVLGPDSWLETLASAEQIAALPAPQNAPEVWQRFAPVAQDAVREGETYYGLPLLLDVHALFINNEWVRDPPQQIEQLTTESTAEHPVSLPLDFRGLYWGLSAFGGSPLQPDGSFVLEESGLIPWLTWLAEKREDSRLAFQPWPPDEPGDTADQLPVAELSFSVSPASTLPALVESLDGALSVAELPAGPQGPARPWATAEVLYMQAALPPDTAELAFDFAAYLTSSEPQTRLAQATRRLPTNVNVDFSAQLDAEQDWEQLVRQLNTAVVPPRTPEMASFAELGATMYADVVLDGRDPAVVACELAEAINTRHGHDVDSCDE